MDSRPARLGLGASYVPHKVVAESDVFVGKFLTRGKREAEKEKPQKKKVSREKIDDIPVDSDSKAQGVGSRASSRKRSNIYDKSSKTKGSKKESSEKELAEEAVVTKESQKNPSSTTTTTTTATTTNPSDNEDVGIPVSKIKECFIESNPYTAVTGTVPTSSDNIMINIPKRKKRRSRQKNLKKDNRNPVTRLAHLNTDSLRARYKTQEAFEQSMRAQERAKEQRQQQQ